MGNTIGRVYWLLIAISILLSTPLLMISSVEQVSNITVKTDKTSYTLGEPVKVSGTVPTLKAGATVAIEVFNPNNQRYTINQVTPSPTGAYSWSIGLGGALAIAGTYTVKATYSGQSVSTTFTLVITSVAPQPDLAWVNETLRITTSDSAEKPIKPKVGVPFLIIMDSKNLGSSTASAKVSFQLVDAEDKGKVVDENWIASSWRQGEVLTVANSMISFEPGTYTLVASLDPAREVAESNENNNIVIHKLTITGVSEGEKSKIVLSEVGSKVFRVNIEGRMFDVRVTGEGTESLVFAREQRAVVLENDGTGGIIEVEIPKELLNGEFTVIADSQELEFKMTETETHSVLLFETPSDSSIISIQGTTVIPEFPFALTALLVGIGIVLFLRYSTSVRSASAMMQGSGQKDG